ncbi:MAG: tRNA (adenosine(37)-N6)-threonylcarbamoyltransferase complex dimerization subunit type 1 TsaB [Phycisphaerae bacterium]|nr:tRNA (adenosine(37)-N6)-threonylcarbamoyltransferase complex dimerization subunit type 1 TsaB [Phycisphaerae bacterium]
MRQKPLILAIETSGRTGSVAIAMGEQMLCEVCFSGPMRHSTEIFPAIEKLLKRFSRKPKEIEHIYISIGPGSFTGLRIAAALAKTMHLANAVKIISVDTLDVIAENATDYIKEEKVKPVASPRGEDLTQIATILDAKRGQFFIATYQNKQGRWEKSTPDCLMTAPQFLEDFAGDSRPVWLLGEGLVYYKDKFKTDVTRFLNERYWNPRAEKVYTLGWQKALAGQFAEALTLQPAYFCRPDIKEKRDAK